jgi:hypothetical protein
MCGGHLLHFPCSRVGHIARLQPYSFPGGRRNIEVYNYKRAVEVKYLTFIIYKTWNIYRCKSLNIILTSGLNKTYNVFQHKAFEERYEWEEDVILRFTTIKEQ